MRYAAEDRNAHTYAVALLAHFRETKAHLPLIRAFTIPDEQREFIWGDMLTETFPARSLSLKASSPEDIWKIHDYLAAKRKETDQKYDCRYSQLILVFGRLLREKWINVEDLSGLAEDKNEAIKRIASW